MSKLTIQVNENFLNKEVRNPKTNKEGKIIFPNYTKAWNPPAEYTTEEIRDLICSGVAIKFGCQEDQEKDNKNSSVDYADGTYIDIDDITEEILNEILDDPLTQYAFLVNRTFSSTYERPSIHISFRFANRIRDWEKITHVNRVLYSYYKDTYGLAVKLHTNGKIDTACYNANRLKFGNNKENSVLHFSPKVFISNGILDSLTDTLNSGNEGSTDAQIKGELSGRTLEIMKMMIEDLSSNIDFKDPNSVFCFYDQHHFEERKSNLNDGVQYDGYDPRDEPIENRSKSFVVTRINTDQWIWRSRAKDIGGNLPEYYYRVAHNDFETPKLTKSQWWQGIQIIYTHFKLEDVFKERFDNSYPKPHVLVELWHQALSEEVCYEIESNSLWIYKDRKWKSVSREYAETMFTKWVRENYRVQILPKAYYDQFQVSYRTAKKSTENFISDYEYYPLAEGLFNYRTKKMIAYHPRYRNTFTSSFRYSNDYHYPHDLERFLKLSLANPEVAKPLIDAMVLSVHRRFVCTGHAFRLQGLPGTGKSTICRILDKLLNPDSVISSSLNLHQFSDPSGNNRFYAAILHNLRFNWFDDVTGSIRNNERFKLLCDGSFHWDRPYTSVETNVMYVQRKMNVICTGQTWITSERNIWKSTAASGDERREYIAEFKNVSDEASRLSENFLKPEWLQNFLLWALHQDAYAIFQEFKKEYRKENWMNEIRQQNKLDKDVIYRFVHDIFEYTGNSNDSIPPAEIESRWKHWKEDEEDRKTLSISKRYLGLRISEILKELYGWDKDDKSCRSKSNGTYLYRKVKLRPLGSDISM